MSVTLIVVTIEEWLQHSHVPVVKSFERLEKKREKMLVSTVTMFNCGSFSCITSVRFGQTNNTTIRSVHSVKIHIQNFSLGVGDTPVDGGEVLALGELLIKTPKDLRIEGASK